MDDSPTCWVVDFDMPCGLPVRAKGLCTKHYMRDYKKGHPFLQESLPFLERFWAKVDKTGPLPKYAPFLGPCWLWTGASNLGYGIIYLPRKPGVEKVSILRAHRLALELDQRVLVRPELVIDHLCRVPLCVRPTHLEAVTSAENSRRGFGATAVNARKTHCKRGHEFTPENTYRYKDGRRQCIACMAVYRNKSVRRA